MTIFNECFPNQIPLFKLLAISFNFVKLLTIQVIGSDKTIPPFSMLKKPALTVCIALLKVYLNNLNPCYSNLAFY